MQLDEKNPYSHYAVAVTHTFAGQCTAATEAAERAVSLSPSFALGYLVLGAANLHAGHPAKAMEPLEHGLRLSPFDPQNFSWLFMFAMAHYLAGQPKEGLVNIRRALALRPQWRAALKMSALCALASGDEAMARRALREMHSSTETGADLTRIIGSLHPSWAAEMDAALQRLEEYRN